MFDYETLRVIWWALIGVLLIGFAIMDGFDFGLAALLRILGRLRRPFGIRGNGLGQLGRECLVDDYLRQLR